MKPAPLALAVLAAALPAARAGEGVPPPRADLVGIAAADARLTTFAALLAKAGLVETLQAEGPVTVFAPTNEAFARLPKETLGALLRDDGRDRLREVLLGHVVGGLYLADDLLGARRLTAHGGAPLTLGLRVGDATVVEADLVGRGGVLHVVDRVLLPAATSGSAAGASVADTLTEAIRRGVPRYNAGDPEGCARIYAEAARELVHEDAPTRALHRLRLERAWAAPGDASERAWTLRRAFDGILADLSFEPRMEASLPAGFPAPGPVGEVVRKRYPSYRAARTSGGNEFWRLFRHIQTHDVSMTAPVEMTMDADLRAVDMAFLYERPNQGEVGPDGSVEVLDLGPTTVLSVAVRGGRDAARIAEARAVLDAALAQDGLHAAGSYRLLGYNSPMVPASRRYWELQIPVHE